MNKKDSIANKHGIRSLSVRLPMLFALSITIMIVIVVGCVYLRFKKQMIENYLVVADGITDLMIEQLDTEKIDEYIEENYQSEEYDRILKYYYSLKDSYRDVLYIYVYKMHDGDPPGATVIFDLDEEYTEDVPQESIDWIGDTYELDEPFSSDISSIIKDGKAVYHEVKTREDGHLFSYVKPVYDKNGRYSCCVCVDFSMTHLHIQDVRFLFSLTVFLLIFSAGIFIIDYRIMSKDITIPLIKMSRCTSEFAYETEEQRMLNVQTMEEVDIRSDDEIGDIYHVFLTVLKDSFFYMHKLEQARRDIREKEEQINYMGKAMYRDDLTGVGNKAAYTEMIREVNEKIKSGRRGYSILMVDINNLKFINDTYGHEKGDAYIKGCCAIMQEICKRCALYRIGGDEFVILLSGNAHRLCQQMVAKLMIAFNRAYTNQNQDDWERYSASVGLASYREGDEDIETVFKRADALMYENKEKFRAKYGSYR